MIIPSPTSSHGTEPFATDEIVRYDDINILIPGTSLLTDDLVCFGDEVVSQLPQDVRVLVQSPDWTTLQLPSRGQPNSSYQWVSLSTEDSAANTRLAAVTQTPRDIKFSIFLSGEGPRDAEPPWPLIPSQGPRDVLPALRLDLYYDPGSHRIILMNRSDTAVQVRSSRMPKSSSHVVTPGTVCVLEPGICIVGVTDHQETLVFRILEKNRMTKNTDATTGGSPNWKKIHDALETKSGAFNFAEGASDSDNTISFLPSGVSSFENSQPSVERKYRDFSTTGNPLLDAELGDTIHIQGTEQFDHSDYAITKGGSIKSSEAWSVFQAKI
jgi:hypothetical protein